MTELNSTDEIQALWLGLTLTPGLGPRGIERLMEYFSRIEAIYSASLTELEQCQIAPAAAQHLHQGRAREEGERELAKARAANAAILLRTQPEYPELLRQIPDAPFLLYVRGPLAALSRPGIAVVGTRRPTPYGKLMAERLGRDLARHGLAIISGLARGIDAIGHEGCLDGQGTAIAVFGTGVDKIYPRENTQLAEKILAQNGALISEFALGTPATPQNFPLRNRIISGLSLGVLVIEGGEFSGSRITSRLALEQNREVYAVPGLVTEKKSWLPNSLLRDGARLVREAVDLVEDLPSWVRPLLTEPSPTSNIPVQDGTATQLSLSGRAILDRLRFDAAIQLDELQASLSDPIPVPELLALLLDLEIGGWVKQLPGQNYVKIQ